MASDYDGRGDELMALVRCSQLEQLRFSRLEVVQTLDEVDDLGNPFSDTEPAFSLRVRIASQPGSAYELVLLCEMESEVGRVAVEAVAVYRVDRNSDDPVDLDKNLVTHFANEVGVMALIPFVRQAIADLTLRVFGGAVLMPVMERGALEFEPPARDHVEGGEDRPAASAASEDTDRS